MTVEDINLICPSFIKESQGRTPEGFYNDFIDKTNTSFSFEDGRELVNLLYSLSDLDEKIINIVLNEFEKMEVS